MTTWQTFPGLRFYWPAIQAAAAKHTFSPLLIAAIVCHESAGNADAFRYEPLFWNRYLKKLPQWATANPRRISSSYGLMQIMFTTAQERGFGGVPEELFVPEVALQYGCLQLGSLDDRLSAKYPHLTLQDRQIPLLASYNGGFQGPDTLRPDNRAYALQVSRRYAQLQTETQPRI